MNDFICWFDSIGIFTTCALFLRLLLSLHESGAYSHSVSIVHRSMIELQCFVQFIKIIAIDSLFAADCLYDTGEHISQTIGLADNEEIIKAMIFDKLDQPGTIIMEPAMDK